MFISHTGELTKFIHRLGASYFLFILWHFNFSYVDFNNYSEELNFVYSRAYSQEDSIFFRFFFFYSTVRLRVFFLGVADRFFLSKKVAMEFPLLSLFIYIGGLFLFRLHTLRDLLLALEIVTLTSYVFIIFERYNRFSTFAGIQYFILGSFPSARLLLSFGLFYLQAGSLFIQDLDLLFNSIFTFFDNNSEVGNTLISTTTEMTSELSKIISSFWYTNTAIDSNFFVDFTSSITSISPLNSVAILGFFFLRFNLLFKLTAFPFYF